MEDEGSIQIMGENETATERPHSGMRHRQALTTSSETVNVLQKHQRRAPDQEGSEHPRVYLVDDDPSLLRSLARRLRAEGLQVETFESAHAFLDHHRPSSSGCAVIDLQMPGTNGLELQAFLAADEDQLPVVFLTAHGDVPSSVRAMKGGAVDFLVKPVRGEDLVDAVHRALTQDAAAREERSLRQLWSDRYHSLTPSERRVFALIVSGLPNKQIADEVGVSERTVKAHRAEVMRKMRVQSPAELGRTMEWLGDLMETPSQPPPS
jgi:FixJ family two-component response regulator